MSYIKGAVRGIIKRNFNYLLPTSLPNPDNPLGGKKELPGNRIERYDNVDEAVLREINQQIRPKIKITEDDIFHYMAIRTTRMDNFDLVEVHYFDINLPEDIEIDPDPNYFDLENKYWVSPYDVLHNLKNEDFEFPETQEVLEHHITTSNRKSFLKNRKFRAACY